MGAGAGARARAGVEGVRARARRETIEAIVEVARAQLGEVGAAALSVRAVTRALGMSASSVYRYFPDRDALLTALILDAYREIGAAAARAESAVDRADLLGRWTAVHRGARGWAVEHPHEYALIYGSPVPGYVAPEDTVAPAAEVVLLLAAIAVEAWTAPGADASAAVGSSETRPTSRPDGSRGSSDPGRPDGPGLAEALLADLHRLLDGLSSSDRFSSPDRGPSSDPLLRDAAGERRSGLVDVDPARVLAVVDAWTELFGSISFELFGHYRQVIDARGEHLDAVARRTAAAAGVVARG